MGACCSGIGTSPSPEETAVKIRARNNFRDKYTQEIEDHQQQKRNAEQGRVWQQEREEAIQVRKLREAGQQNRNKQRQERDRKLQEEQRKEEDRRKRKEVERYDKAQQMPDDSYSGYSAPQKHQIKQNNVQSTGLPVRTENRREGKAQRDGDHRGKRNEQGLDKSPDETNATFHEISLKEDDQTAVFNEQRPIVKGKQPGGGIHIIQPDVGKEQPKDDRQQRSKVRQRAATVPDEKGMDRNRKQDDMLPKGPRKPIKRIGQPDKRQGKLKLENVGDDILEKRPRKPKDVEDAKLQRAQEIDEIKIKKKEKTIHPEVSENGPLVPDVDSENRERALTAHD